MTTLQARKIKGALRKATRVGRVEDSLSISGCSIVIQNLSPSEHEDVLSEIGELEDIEYYHAYQMANLSRSIVEIDGVDLRDVKFVECEVPSGAHVVNFSVNNIGAAEKALESLSELGIKATIIGPEDGERTVKVEKHEWLKDSILKSWGREALAVGWRKFAELLVTAEDKAKDGVRFDIPDETAENKLRRLLSEIKEVEEELPDELLDRVLDNSGYMRKSTQRELDAVVARTSKLAEEQAKQAPAASQEAEELMRSRQPLNRSVVQTEPVNTPPEPVRAPQQLKQVPFEPPVISENSRSAKIAALEASVDPLIMVEANQTQAFRLSDEVPELSEKQSGVNGGAVSSILDRPPSGGLNPHFRKPIV